MSSLVRTGIELGTADDIVTNRTSSKTGGGTVGVLTREIVPRAEYYEQALLLAMVGFVNHELFWTGVEENRDCVVEEVLKGYCCSKEEK